MSDPTKAPNAAGPSDGGSATVSPRDVLRLTWPAVLATALASLGFAGLKFIMVNEMALEFDPAAHQPLPFDWAETIVQNCIKAGNIEPAITQGVAAAITLGVIAGYFVNAPLAGLWRCGRLFIISGLATALASLVIVVLNPWIVLFVVGGAYGAACAARGKTIPLLAQSARLTNTFSSGLINAAMVIGLLAGTILGTYLASLVDLAANPGANPNWASAALIALGRLIGMNWLTHGMVAAALLAGALAGVAVRPPEPPPIPFRQGARELFSGTTIMFRRHWPLLVGGGLAWGVVSAMSLAMYVDVQDRLELSKNQAATLAMFSVIGAVVGNLVSDRLCRRRHVLAEFFLLALAVDLYPMVVLPAWGYWGAAVAAIVIGTLFAAGANVLDARFLRLSAEEGQSGRGSTLMSLTHSIFIFLVGTGAAVALLLNEVSATKQFSLFAIASLLTMGVAAFADLGGGGKRSGRLPAVRIPHREGAGNGGGSSNA